MSLIQACKIPIECALSSFDRRLSPYIPTRYINITYSSKRYEKQEVKSNTNFEKGPFIKEIIIFFEIFDPPSSLLLLNKLIN